MTRTDRASSVGYSESFIESVLTTVPGHWARQCGLGYQTTRHQWSHCNKCETLVPQDFKENSIREVHIWVKTPRN